MDKESFKRTKLSVLALRLISPGYGHCQICGLPWNHCEQKDVMISEYHGVFATCQYCWDNSSLEDLEGAYSKLYHSWEMDGSIVHVDFSKSTMLNAVEKEYAATHTKKEEPACPYCKSSSPKFIEITKNNKDIVMDNIKKRQEQQYLEMQNDEFNYGHNVPNHTLTDSEN